jgi:hypothetical protein
MRTIKYMIIALMMVVCAASVSANVWIGSVQEDTIGEEFLIHYNVKNLGDDKITNGKMNLWIPDLNLYYRTHSFTLRGDSSYKGFMFPLESYYGDIEPGTYLARIKFTSDYEKASRWTWLTIE